jgi:sterol desaturase/sphingolipid hydroxylase (fatty acid hydroxylase superfamily)
VSLDLHFKRWFGDDEPTRFGTGWISGVLSVLLGALSFGGVLCFHFPWLLTAPDLRTRYPVDVLRWVLLGTLVLACLLAGVSAVLRRRKVLALTGLAFTAAAVALGGSSVPLPDAVDSQVGLGLEWFVLNLLLLTALFVPLERARPLREEQLVFREGWTTDGVHFAVSHLLVQLFTLASLTPALMLRERIGGPELGGWPLALQVLCVAALTDLAQYWVHRALHRIPALWRLHAVHHSSREMDWLAGSRLHLLDALLTRSLCLMPSLLLGLSPAAIGVYLALVSFHAVFIHTNFGASLRWLEPWLVTPRIHHFHHADEREAIDTNFAVHFPIYDRLFGTRFLPEGRWAHAYGIGGEQPPSGWWGQLRWPFR